MLSQLPTELLYQVFDQLESYQDLSSLSFTCHRTFLISQGTTLRRKLFERLFRVEQNKIFVQDNDLFTQLCHFIEAAKINPTSSSIMHVLEKQIKTSHFVDYHYPSSVVKAKILDVFRSKCQEVKDNLAGIPVSKAARHITQSGPRRVYYDVTVDDNKYKCIFYDLNKVVAFVDNSSYTVHQGTMQFKDEGILSDVSWSAIFKAKQGQASNMVLPSADMPPSDSFSSKMMPSTQILVTPRTPSDWQPCLLHTYQHCVLQTKIKKGCLARNQTFDYVFVYENRHDDAICIEFCSTGESSTEPVSRGYLLMKEHAIQWDTAPTGI
ncbi:hypothetical protein V8B55DRAFT_1463295 [Mucor lusitanicus]|uniref:F-box domain-containing protein n=2 Tax=Mucor circinelloides f. lusitanicus TaxID=29924 RepID=A0A168JRI9_MUCCL|nr:hypothetical protein FB192DRAFT_1354395 [Mucor lusitanicus]OAD01528.1 hypothetical protein MUCCIDRAFT_185005 [Mucor lusitanicus CBS 277.49]